MFFSRFISEVHGVWVGWVRSFDPAPSLMTIIEASFIGVICIAGCLYRVYRKKFDSIYVVIYFGMIVLWLSSEDAVRYLYVIVPLFLLYGLLLIRYPVRVLTALKPAVLGYVYLAVIALTALPEIGLLIQRLEMGTDQENRQYAKSLYWYSTQDLDRARLKINAYKKFVTSWQRISTLVRKDECIYSVDPTWLMLYSDRRSYSVPWVFTKNEFYNQANACRYVYVGSYMRPPFSPFYPKDYLIENGRVVFVDRMEDMKGRPVLGMLIEKPR
jgi:hypothetical protein